MVTAVAPHVPYSYYNVLNPTAPLAPPAVPPVAPAGQGNNNNANGAPANTSGEPTLSSQLIAVLQTFAPSGSANAQTSKLLGGSGSKITGSVESTILGGSYQAVLSTAYRGAIQKAAAGQQAANNPLQKLLADTHSGINAYNNAVIRQGYDTVKAIASQNVVV